ncbi:MAG: SurA N-terminal domain-containing protein [bacterium]|nr:SurA N-terminal domain-containing protein [bacterium]
MLEFMRKNAGSWVIKILLFGIVIVFAFWGVGSYSNRDANTVLTIGDVRVPYNEYRDMYNTLVETYRGIYENLDSATLDFLDIRGQAVEKLKERYLLLEAARRLDVDVAGEEVAARIANTPAFQENGGFSPRRYQLFLDINRMTPEAYESSLAREIAIGKVTTLIRSTAVITPQEVNDNLHLLTRKARTRILRFDPNDFVRDLPEPVEEELMDFFEVNIESYRIPEMFRQNIAIIDPAQAEPDAAVTVEEIEDWYEDQEAEYTEPAAYRISHILFALPRDASAESISAVRVRAEEVVGRIRDGKIDFASAVRQYSDDVASSGKGGNLGLFKEGEMDRSIRDAVSGLETDEVTDPIPTSSGFEVIRLDSFRESRLIPFDEVRNAIEKQIRKEKAFEISYDLADDLLDEVLGSDESLDKLAKARGLMTITTPLFSRDSALETMELPAELLKAAFDTEVDEVGDIYERGGKLYLFQTIERNPSYLPELDKVRDNVLGSFLVSKAMDLALARAQEFREALEGGRSLASMARDMKRQPIEPEPFTILDASIAGVDDAEPVIHTAFAIGQPGGSAVASGRQAHYLVILDGFVDADEAELAEKRATVEESLRSQRELDLLNGYIQALKDEMADQIVVNEQLL